MQAIRIGHGYDVHAFSPGRQLILGGVDLPCDQGLLGHSDADVLLHAAMDAILGALALGDIGAHFPDTDPMYKGADSRALLRAVREMMKERGYKLGNLDCTVIAQAPKLAPDIEQMRRNLAGDLQTELENISVKATTEEHLGFTGRREGISAHSVCLLLPIETPPSPDRARGPAL